MLSITLVASVMILAFSLPLEAFDFCDGDPNEEEINVLAGENVTFHFTKELQLSNNSEMRWVRCSQWLAKCSLESCSQNQPENPRYQFIKSDVAIRLPPWLEMTFIMSIVNTEMGDSGIYHLVYVSISGRWSCKYMSVNATILERGLIPASTLAPIARGNITTNTLSDDTKNNAIMISAPISRQTFIIAIVFVGTCSVALTSFACGLIYILWKKYRGCSHNPQGADPVSMGALFVLDSQRAHDVSDATSSPSYQPSQPHGSMETQQIGGLHGNDLQHNQHECNIVHTSTGKSSQHGQSGNRQLNRASEKTLSDKETVETETVSDGRIDQRLDGTPENSNLEDVYCSIEDKEISCYASFPGASNMSKTGTTDGFRSNPAGKKYQIAEEQVVFHAAKQREYREDAAQSTKMNTSHMHSPDVHHEELYAKPNKRATTKKSKQSHIPVPGDKDVSLSCPATAKEAGVNLGAVSNPARLPTDESKRVYDLDVESLYTKPQKVPHATQCAPTRSLPDEMDAQQGASNDQECDESIDFLFDSSDYALLNPVRDVCGN